MSEKWGSWQCPYDGCNNRPDDPDFPRITCCGVDGHNVLLGPIENGHRWAVKYEADDTDIRMAIIHARLSQ